MPLQTATRALQSLGARGDGVPLWTNRYNGPANGSNEAGAFAMAVDSDGNVFVTGFSYVTPVSRDYATIKYSGAGVALWTNLYSGPANDDNVANTIAVDTSGNVIVTGRSGNGVQGSDYATIAYSGAGVPLWTNRYHGPGPASAGVTASGMAVDNKGNVIVTGNSVTIKYSAIVPAPPRLNVQRLNNQLVLTWTNAGFSLQSAPDLTSTFTNVPSATSPYTNALTAPRQFFRLNSQ